MCRTGEATLSENVGIRVKDFLAIGYTKHCHVVC